MTSSILRAASILAIVAFLAGCATTPEAAIPSATVTPTTTAAPVSSKPEPRFDLACDDLATAASVSALVGKPLQQRDPLAIDTSRSNLIPFEASLVADGGLSCAWGTEESWAFEQGGENTGAWVAALPTDGAAYAQRLQRFEDDHGLRCWYLGIASCTFSSVMGDYWVTLAVEGLPGDHSPSDAPPVGVTELLNSVTSQVTALGPPTVRWNPPAGTVMLASECDSFFLRADAMAALGLSDEPYDGQPLSGPCPLRLFESVNFAYTLSWLQSGAWAAEEVLPMETNPSTITPVTVANLAAEDLSYIRCSVEADRDYTNCTIDLIIGGNWVQVNADGDSNARDRTITLAGAVAAKIYG
jgi:hypothetical protein